jgi:hypothetical protein
MVRRSRIPRGSPRQEVGSVEIHYPHSGFGYIVVQSLEAEHAMG